MGKNVNQHYVPQFYFRNFSVSKSKKSICLLNKVNGKAYLQASIKGQCSKANFYGCKYLEQLISQLEVWHSSAIKKALNIASKPETGYFSAKELADFIGAVTFQRGRVPLELEKTKSTQENLVTDLFKYHLQSLPQNKDIAEVINKLDSREIFINFNSKKLVALNVSTCMSLGKLLFDLKICFLRNNTDYPFIFSDAPVVFYNSYCQNVHDRSCLGFASQGLQIFYPLSSQVCAMLYDGDKYNGSFYNKDFFDIIEKSDISKINTLQLHHSLKNVYFGNPKNKEYVENLWKAHHCNLRKLKSTLKKEMTY